MLKKNIKSTVNVLRITIFALQFQQYGTTAVVFGCLFINCKAQ